MVAWLQAFPLLLLLVLSSPGADAASNQHLCGSHLVEALFLVCGERGFFFNPDSKTDVDSLLVKAETASPKSEDNWLTNSFFPQVTIHLNEVP